MNISLFSVWSQIAKWGLMHQLCHYGCEFCLLSSLANSFHPVLTSYKRRGFLSSEMLGLLVPTRTVPKSSLTIQECPQPILCLRYNTSSGFPTCQSALTTQHWWSLFHCPTFHPSCAPQHLQLKEWGVWTKERLESHQRLCWSLAAGWGGVALRRRHRPECSGAALWPNTWGRSVAAHHQLLLGLGFFVTAVVAVLLLNTHYTFAMWRTQPLFQRTTSTDYLCI